ncbi:MAG: hypothetical protein AAFQ13_10920, partial [Pseudomonadota bacterium]
MTPRFACGLTAFALFAPFPLSAQDEDEVSDEPEIVVTGEGLEPALSTGVYAGAEIPRDLII